MSGEKPRCRKCLYAENTAKQTPCCKCSEIQYTVVSKDNYFVENKKESVEK